MGRFDLIGRHEDRERAVGALSPALGLRLDTAVHENVTSHSSERDEASSDPRIIAELESILADDIRFYEMHTRNVFGQT